MSRAATSAGVVIGSYGISSPSSPDCGGTTRAARLAHPPRSDPADLGALYRRLRNTVQSLQPAGLARCEGRLWPPSQGHEDPRESIPRSRLSVSRPHGPPRLLRLAIRLP